MPEAMRTLVKSGPELWAEIADPAAMARHLSPFGGIRITRAEPERLVEWEGDRARGAVRLEPSGFGTRVILTVAPRAPEPGRGGLWRRFTRRPLEPPSPVADAESVLAGALDALGTARHRPFSRA